jgi:hypothetical protein
MGYCLYVWGTTYPHQFKEITVNVVQKLPFRKAETKTSQSNKWTVTVNRSLLCTMCLVTASEEIGEKC